MFRALSISLLGLVLIARQTASAQVYSLTDLGALGGAWSKAWGINDAGQVVGQAQTANGDWHAFLWTPTNPNGIIGTMADLGTLGGSYSDAYDINNLGQVVGSAFQTSGIPHAFLYAMGGPPLDLGTLGGTSSIAYGVNASGQVVGWAYDANENPHGFLWTPGSGMIDLGTSTAYRINDAGQVIGWNYDANENPHGFLWTPGSGTIDLGTFGGTSSAAHGINRFGQIVGWAYDADQKTRAFLWTPTTYNGTVGSLTDLGTFGGAEGWASAINDAGQVIGGAKKADGSVRPFLWDAVNGMRDLESLVANASNWWLSDPRAINNVGQIVGYGYKDGDVNPAPKAHAFLLTPTASISVVSLTLNPHTLRGTQSSTGTVTITSPAPANGAGILLTSTNPVAHVPHSVIVPPGATSVNFPITTDNVSASTTSILRATANGVTRGATLTILPATPHQVTLTPNSIRGGNSVIGTVTLNGKAASGGLSVALSSTNPAAQVPANVIVPEGQSSATFTVTTSGVSATIDVVIKAAANGTERGATLRILSAFLHQTTLNPNQVHGGASSTGTVMLNGKAPAGGLVVTLSSTNTSVAQVPASVTIPEGQSSATFTVTTNAVTSTVSLVIRGKANGVERGATLIVHPAVPYQVTLNPNQVHGGASSTGTVILSGKAPAGGLVVTLSSANTSVAQVPATVTVPAGQSSATFTVTTSAVAATTNVVIKATANGVDRGATLRVIP